MFVSDARREANRRNAQLSTGPRTELGKSRSRANGLKHGLCATVVQAEDADLVRARSSEFFRSLAPQDEYQNWLVNEAAIISVRIDRCERMERRVRDKVCLRAELTWDDNRRLEAELLGATLSTRPAEVVEVLRRTPHGCDWLMNRWAMLAHAALHDDSGQWTEEQANLAFDLLGTPALFRVGTKPGVEIDLDGNIVEAAGDGAAVARRMVADLKGRREVVAGLDEVERALAEVDLDHDSDPELRRIRRYESMLHTRLRWAVGQATQDPLKRPVNTFLRPAGCEDPKPEPKSKDEILAEKHDPNSFSPPFCLTPDEFPPPGQKADIPAILESRKEKRLAKAKARREARRRKVEKLCQ